jgi:hypothetical protein
MKCAAFVFRFGLIEPEVDANSHDVLGQTVIVVDDRARDRPDRDITGGCEIDIKIFEFCCPLRRKCPLDACAYRPPART